MLITIFDRYAVIAINMIVAISAFAIGYTGRLRFIPIFILCLLYGYSLLRTITAKQEDRNIVLAGLTGTLLLWLPILWQGGNAETHITEIVINILVYSGAILLVAWAIMPLFKNAKF